MNITVIQVQILIIERPCSNACRVQSPLDQLSERLRREMQFGRDHDRGPIDSFDTTINAASYDYFQQT